MKTTRNRRACSVVPRLALALLVAAQLSGCGADSADNNPVSQSVNSQFTAAGIEAMKSSRAVRLDFTALPLTMESLGFQQGSDGAMVATDSDKPMSVSMTTPGGIVGMDTDTIRVRPGGDGEVDRVDIFVTYPNAQDANAEIRKAVNELGIVKLQDAPAIGPEFTDGSGKDEWNPGCGNATGTVFSVQILSDHTTGRMTFIYSAELSRKYYTTEAQASIAATGKLPAAT